ncbi:(2Fe-2S)-binding protein [Parahaliea mediterranea]|uniref:(2Fe-2S)-binding protein n=1 Tax=Parahaliea mediterranea TaxID=651086 RepID=A0A939DCA7_9GAMM|nr:(2Fe-2S)-binding protein [Parahaliea mediterranea]MBN7795593.1 (2Fe-2S)-binding protein [Parahaliea mediterranea]
MASRIEQGVQRGPQITLTVDGERVAAWAGESLATLLLLRDRSAFYRTRGGAPRAPFCNMGTCFECRVHVAGRGWVLACMSPAEDGMEVTTGETLPRIEVGDGAH